MEVEHQPVAKVELLIRRPVSEVFEAFVSPDTITKFWFDRSSGRLASGQAVLWYWDLYDASSEVRVKDIEKTGEYISNGTPIRTTPQRWNGSLSLGQKTRRTFA